MHQSEKMAEKQVFISHLWQKVKRGKPESKSLALKDEKADGWKLIAGRPGETTRKKALPKFSAGFDVNSNQLRCYAKSISNIRRSWSASGSGCRCCWWCRWCCCH